MISLAFIPLLLYACSQGVLSAPAPPTTPVNATDSAGSQIVPSKVIVTLKEHVDLKSLPNVTTATKLDLINGYIVDSSEVSIADLRADPNVASVEEDQVMTIAAGLHLHKRARKYQCLCPPDDDKYVTRHETTWGLQRITSKTKLQNQDPYALTYDYTHYEKAGEGVDVYVIDTGVRTTHQEFEGRARWGATFGGYQDADGHGHGTHCAGTVAGKRFGVSDHASIIAVKVLSDYGSGALSDVIAGMDWVSAQAQQSGRPTVVSMSLAGGASSAMDLAVQRLTQQNIHVVVASANAGTDADLWSPARAPEAITVGAMDIADARPPWSNYGAGVDIHAPGVAVTSAWNTDDSATNNISGTSMATPHVAGMVAYVISLKGNKPTEEMANFLKQWAIKDAISEIPDGTPNVLAHIVGKN